MKNKIKEVHDYFKKKIVNGDYDIIEHEELTMTISIDNEYQFCLWMANDGYNFGVYYGQMNAMHVVFNKAEKADGYRKANETHKKYKQTELLAQKRKELEELENELK